MKQTVNRRDAEEKPEREGDVLGISDADPDVEIPFRGERGKGHPAGIEVGKRATGIGDVPQSQGAAGIDMGAAGKGTDISSHSTRPSSTERDEPETEE